MEVFIKFDFYSAGRKLAHFSCVQVMRRYEMFMYGPDSLFSDPITCSASMIVDRSMYDFFLGENVKEKRGSDESVLLKKILL